MKKWRCGGCGYVWDGEQPPEKCPKCGAPKSAFSEIPAEEVQLIEKARLTNEMHVAIMSISKKMQKWAETIQTEALDPNCTEIAQKVLKDTNEIIQSIKAELEAHMKKHKWG